MIPPFDNLLYHKKKNLNKKIKIGFKKIILRYNNHKVIKMKNKKWKKIGWIVGGVAFLFLIVGSIFFWMSEPKEVGKKLDTSLSQVQSYRMQLDAENGKVTVENILSGNQNHAYVRSTGFVENAPEAKYDYDLVDQRMRQTTLLPNGTWDKRDYYPHEGFVFDVDQFDVTKILFSIHKVLPKEEKNNYQVTLSREERGAILNPFVMLVSGELLETLREADQMVLNVKVSDNQKEITEVTFCIDQCQTNSLTLHFDQYNQVKKWDGIK